MRAAAAFCFFSTMVTLPRALVALGVATAALGARVDVVSAREADGSGVASSAQRIFSYEMPWSGRRDAAFHQFVYFTCAERFAKRADGTPQGTLVVERGAPGLLLTAPLRTSAPALRYAIPYAAIDGAPELRGNGGLMAAYESEERFARELALYRQ